MTSLEVIDNILHNRFRADRQDILIEFGTDVVKGEKSIIMQLGIDNRSGADNYSLYKFDSATIDPFPYFNRISGLKKFADYIMFAQRKAKLYIFIFELKYNNGNSHKQLEASCSFVNYIIDTARRIGYNIVEKDIVIQTVRVKGLAGRTQKIKNKMSNFIIQDGHIIYDWTNLRIKALLDFQ